MSRTSVNPNIMSYVIFLSFSLGTQVYEETGYYSEKIQSQKNELSPYWWNIVITPLTYYTLRDTPWTLGHLRTFLSQRGRQTGDSQG